MAKVKLTKTELKAQSDALKRFQRFLPMLQLKKQQLQSEIAGITAKADAVTARERELRSDLNRWVGLFATDESLLAGLVSVKGVKTGMANIAGVPIPTFESIETDVKEVDLWATPAWVDSAVAATTQILSLQCERAIYEEQRRLVTEELQQTSQRVNLFEKVKIPACKEAIRVIKIALGDEQTAALGLLENIQRADLNPFEQAQGMKDVMVLWDCTQAEAAKRLGMAQPTFATKLRLLQLTADQRQFVLDNNLTERHARAVLRLPEKRRSEALITIAKRRLNARQTDSYIEQLLNSPPKAGHRISMVRDVRIFVNTIDHAIRLMTDNGVPATAHREEKDGYIEYTVRIPTAAAEK